MESKPINFKEFDSDKPNYVLIDKMSSGVSLGDVQEEEGQVKPTTSNVLSANGVTVYQPAEDHQLSLAEYASCLAVKTFLKMCKIPVSFSYVDTAEFIFPRGRLTHLPVLRHEKEIVSEFQPIVELVENITAMHSGLSEDEEPFLNDVKVFTTYIEDEFTLAELYMSFKNKQNYLEFTRSRCYPNWPWVLSILERRHKNARVNSLLKIHEWHEFSEDDVLQRFEALCSMLDGQLEGNSESDMRFCQTPMAKSLDACVYGHVAAILNAPMPNNQLGEILKQHENLLRFCAFIEKQKEAK